MSCDHNRQKYFKQIAPSAGYSAEALENIYQANRQPPINPAGKLAAEAKTRLFFAAMRAAGLKPPTHSASGLPRVESCLGYAAIYDFLRLQGVLTRSPEPRAETQTETETLLQSSAQSVSSVPVIPPGMTAEAWAFWCDPANQAAYDLSSGRDPQGYDRWGYDAEGFDRAGYDRQGYDRKGYDRKRFDRRGRNRKGYGRNGFDVQGFNRKGFDRGGYDRHGYDKNGSDREGYDLNGYKDGYDRAGYDEHGLDRGGQKAAFFTPNAEGFYADGYDADGFDKDGYDVDDRDRFGFDREGYNVFHLDRNGRDRKGLDKHGCDNEGYDRQGYKPDTEGVLRDRLGYDKRGLDPDGCSWTGFDEDGLDRNGQPRRVKNARGKRVEPKYCKSGWDRERYDRWGYHKEDGLTMPDEQGRRFNLYGWVYDADTEECFDPQDPTRRMAHNLRTYTFQVGGNYAVFDPGTQRRTSVAQHGKLVPSGGYQPSNSSCQLPLTPRATMSREEYLRTVKEDSYFYYVPYEKRLKPDVPSLQTRWHTYGRALADDKACLNGVRLRCPHCGQFTGGDGHTCPHFPHAHRVNVFASGVVEDIYDRVVSSTPNDLPGRDDKGRDGHGFDIDGYSPDGYDLFGRDRDGFDRRGFNNAGVNRHGERRPRDLATVLENLEIETDPLAHKDLADLYSRIASGLVGQPRRVVLREEGGFATDMQGTIYADPYPLGRNADPRHNLVVTRAGIYHELGHELFTPSEVWARVLAVAESEETSEGLETPARQALPRFLNIVEDGRMERCLCGRYAGTAEVLSASCQIEPRWDEHVGENTPVGEQVFWSLLYTALPFYRLRPQVKDALSQPARELFDELEPIVKRAVLGDAEDAYRAAVHLARRFQEEDLLDEMPDQQQDYSQPESPSGNTGQGQSKGMKQGDSQEGEASQDGQGQEKGDSGGDTSKDAQAGSGQGSDSQAGETDGKQPEDGSELCDPAESFTQADLGAVLDSVEGDTSSALDAGLRARTRPDQIGKPLHRPLFSGQTFRSQRYRGLDGLPQTERVETPESNNVDLLKRLAERRAGHRKVASDMARSLKAVRQQADQRLGRQTNGKLDRRHLSGAVKGSREIYTRTRQLPQTSFAASIAVDLSGSMGEHVAKGDLYDAAMTLGDTFEQLDVAYEVRGFGSYAAQFKAIDDANFEPQRAAYLAERTLGGTIMAPTCGLAAAALQARPEKNRLFVSLTDGEANDHEQAVAQVQEARRRGIVCFGIFLGNDPNPARLDEIYGRGNWTKIEKLSDMPRAVGQRMASIFKSLRR